MQKIAKVSSTRIATLASGFIAGVIVLGFGSGLFTGAVQQGIERSRALGYEAGYAAASAESPAVTIEENDIHIISNAVFMESMEVELKAVAQLTNAIEFTYGEKGGERERVSALHPGDAIARRIGNKLYVIKNVAVSANLQRATVQVTQITLPPP